MVGRGTATTFQVFGAGPAISTGPDQWNLVCVSCDIRVSYADGEFERVQGGAVDVLGAGAYEYREFTGAFHVFDNGPHDFTILVYGAGEFNQIG